MLITVGQIVRVWHDYRVEHSVQVLIIIHSDGTLLGDSIHSEQDNETICNYLNVYVYICDEEHVPNNRGDRRTGRLMLNADGTIRLAQNNHTIIGQRVDIEIL